MFNFHKLISFDYLFLVNTVLMTRSDRLFMLTGVIALVLAIVLKIAAISSPSPVDKKFRNKFFDLLLTIGIWEIVWYGFRFENINFFGSHFVALLGLLVGLVWFIILLVKIIRQYSAEKQGWEKEQVKLKYLPH